MEEEIHADAEATEKCRPESILDTDDAALINENSNGLSHLLAEGEFNSVEAIGVDDSSTSNPTYLNTVELSTESVGDYLDNNTEAFNTGSFDVGDNAVQFPSDSLNMNLDGDSHLSNVFKKNDNSKVISTDNEVSNDTNNLPTAEENTEDMVTQTNESDSESHDVNDSESHDANEAESSDAVREDSSETNVEVNSHIQDKKQNILKESGEEKPKQEENSEVAEEVGAEAVQVGGAEETEVVSEDELPSVEKPSVKDAENVSDDELPGPKPAELPADTEVVSEDELPSSKKEKESRKRKPDEDDAESPTAASDSEHAAKKQAVVKNGESKPVPAEKRLSTEEKPKKKNLPELDKYWKVVNDDPTDFTGWTYLLQYVDQESETEAAREAYDAFLSHYPYCYGYWRKYADYEKKKGSKKKCLEVLERGLKSIPLSVDLWIHYLNHIKTTRAEDLAYIRSQYERAIEACGLEFRSDRLWESYVKWESDNGTPLAVTGIYDRLLATPTLGYTTHFDNFQEHIQSEPVTGSVPAAELVRLRAEVRAAAPAPPALDLPPGEDEPADHVASEEEAQSIKERIIAARRKVHKATGEEVAARWTFEEGIKRPYFHVKPLERCQLKNWKAYLEWERTRGSLRRALVLHERCLIACALYEEFWMRLVRFLEERSASHPELVGTQREVLERACTVHHLDKPELHLCWAQFEEAQGNAPRAADILERIDKTCPNVVQIQYRRVNLERRRGDLDRCQQLYEAYIAGAKSKPVASALAVKYARFLFHTRRDPAGARAALDAAVAREPLNARLHAQRLDLALHTPGTAYEELDELVQSYERQEGAEGEASVGFAWRRRELAEELGDAAAARRAHAHHRAVSRHVRRAARRDKHDQPPPAPDAKKEPPAATSAPAAAPAAPPYYSGAGGQYEQTYPQGYQPAWGYQQPPYQHPHAPWPQYPNYY